MGPTKEASLNSLRVQVVLAVWNRMGGNPRVHEHRPIPAALRREGRHWVAEARPVLLERCQVTGSASGCGVTREIALLDLAENLSLDVFLLLPSEEEEKWKARLVEVRKRTQRTMKEKRPSKTAEKEACRRALAPLTAEELSFLSGPGVRKTIDVRYECLAQARTSFKRSESEGDPREFAAMEARRSSRVG
jgi:hypothetical protein